MQRQFSAGGAVFKKESGKTYWLIIKPKPSLDFPKERYQLPKGLIDEGESSENAAVREVKEETGIEAKIATKIEDSRYVFSFKGEKIFKTVTYYLMEYVSGEPRPHSVETEQVLWLPVDEALDILTHSSDRAILQKANYLLSRKNSYP